MQKLELKCPHCHHNLAYTKHGRTFSRVLGVEIKGVYDGVLYWKCPDCGGRWHRFDAEHALHKKAEPYVEAK